MADMTGWSERSDVAQQARGARRIPAFCHLCGQRLAGRYFRHSNGLTFCEACSAARPRCARCAAPLDDVTLASARLTPAREPALCRRCTRTAPHCAACQQAIIGSWYTFEELMPPPTPRRFCERCVTGSPRCDLCRVPVAPYIAPLDDGQYRCARCAADMIVGNASVTAVYDDARRLFAQLVGLPRSTPQVEIVSRLRMGEVRHRYERQGPTGELAATAGHHVLGFFVRSHGRSTIYVERALPRSLLLGTLAHELGHAWQAEHAPDLREPLLCEGFAEWAAYCVLTASGLREMAARAVRRDDLYGRGLRHFLEIERASGRTGVLAAARGA
jgi:hypothetical protein